MTRQFDVDITCFIVKAEIEEAGLRVLVVDDEINSASGLQVILVRRGLDVDVATSTTEAIHLLKTHRYAVVVSDASLADRDRGEGLILDNLDLIGAARKILITGMSPHQILRKEELFDAGVMFFEKPAGMPLISAIEALAGAAVRGGPLVQEHPVSSVAHALQVFLCHSSADKPLVRKLYRQLSDKGFDPWLDEEKLMAGQDWDLEIQKAVRSSDAVVVCLSKDAVTKEGYVQKELKVALETADRMPEGAIFIIPLLLDDCSIPERLRRLHYVKLFDARGEEKLIQALDTRRRLKRTG